MGKHFSQNFVKLLPMRFVKHEGTWLFLLLLILLIIILYLSLLIIFIFLSLNLILIIFIIYHCCIRINYLSQASQKDDNILKMNRVSQVVFENDSHSF